MAVCASVPARRGRAGGTPDNERYRDMARDVRRRWRGAAPRAGCTCTSPSTPTRRASGCLDRIAPWLPVLLAVSANSPYDEGRDTGYASWRTQLWSTWPSAGPTEAFGSLAGYRRACERMIASGAARDPGDALLRRAPVRGAPDARGPGPRRGDRPRGRRAARRPGPGPGGDRGRRLARAVRPVWRARSCGPPGGGRPATGSPTTCSTRSTHDLRPAQRGAVARWSTWSRTGSRRPATATA